jgi:hypothetical protein
VRVGGIGLSMNNANGHPEGWPSHEDHRPAEPGSSQRIRAIRVIFSPSGVRATAK